MTEDILNNFLVKNKKYILAAIIGLAVFLIFFRLTRADIQTDDAIYSFKALGYFDFTDSQLQLTPINWFEKIPFWSKLSFHDAPPLVFIIQYLFFKILGISTLSARLPFALAGVGSVILLYFVARRLYNEKIALLSSFLLTIFTYHTWASRIGYLEPIALFFILLALLWFLKGLEQEKNFIWFGIFLGLMMLTKYTTFFLLPTIFFYILFKEKAVFTSKYFIVGIVIAILLFSPVIFYNLKMYQARGHFDLQFATLLKQNISKDWPIFSSGSSPGFNLAGAFNTIKALKSFYSLPVYLLILISLFYLVIIFLKNIKENKNLILFLILFFLILQFSFVGGSARFLLLFNPFLALTLAVFLFEILQNIFKINRQKPLVIYLSLSLLILILSFEAFYNLNTNHFFRSLGDKDKNYSSLRLENGGFAQLENYLIKEGNLAGLKKKQINGIADLMIDLSEEANGENIFTYDPNLNWFSTLWYFRRWAVYYHKFFIPAADLAMAIPPEEWFDYFRQSGAKNIYYIRGKDEVVFDAGHKDEVNQKGAAALEALFRQQVVDQTSIINRNNQLVFKVYKLKLN